MQAVQWHFWRLTTLGYHITNLVLHIIGALLVWRLSANSDCATRGWVDCSSPCIPPWSSRWRDFRAEEHALAPAVPARDVRVDRLRRAAPSRDYWSALGLFLLAMLCKVSMALFPFVMLLYAWWKRGRIGWIDLKATAPFFAISFVLGLTTVPVRQLVPRGASAGHAESAHRSFVTHIALAGWSMAFYFTRCLWPVHMLFIYPKWQVDASFSAFLPWLVAIAMLTCFWIKRATWGRHALLGTGFFLINLAPFVGSPR